MRMRGMGFCDAVVERGCSADAGEGVSALQLRSEIAVRKPEKGQVHCRCGAGLQCGSRRRVKSTAAAERDCSAEAGEGSRALQLRSGIAVRMPEIGQEHCRCGAGLQCGSRRRGKCTATAELDCSAEAEEGASALQPRSGIAVRKLEIGQVHCRRKPERQCGSQKTSKCTAAAERDCSTEAGDRASALSQEAGKTVRKPENKQEHCNCGAGLQCGSR